MTTFLRLASRSLLALAVTGMLGLNAQATTFPAREPSPTGAYLAGTQALSDLRTAEAARYFRDALAVDANNPLIILRAFVAYAANGNIKEASATARRLISHGTAQNLPLGDLARLVIATDALKERRYAAAIDELKPVTSETFSGIAGGILRAWAHAGAGRFDEANAALDGIGEGGLEDFLVFHRALVAEVAGDSATALAYAQQAYDADPLVARIVETLARYLGNAGRFDEAAEVIARFEREGISHPLVTQVKQAVDAKRRPGPLVTSAQAGAAEMFHGMGVALARDRTTDISVVFLRLGLYLDPNADVIALVLGQILDGAGQHTVANTFYDGIPANSPMKPTAVVRVASNLDAMGDRDEALRRLTDITRVNPNDLDAVSVLGDLQRSAERYDEAVASYSQALSITGGNRPGDWRLYFVRGITYERSKQWPKAEADFQRALELRPNQPQVLNYLGYSWVDQGINLTPALDLIEKAVEQAPNDGYIVDSLGWAFFRLGRFDEAVEALEAAVRLRPNDPEINDHLGDAYWRVGRELEARFQWSIAVSVDKDGNVRERAQSKLATGLEPLDLGKPASVAANANEAGGASGPAATTTSTQ